MEVIVTLVEKSGPLLVIFAVFMMTYLEDRKNNKNISERMIKVVEENTATNEKMGDKLAGAMEYHDELDGDVKDIKTTLSDAISKIEKLEESANGIEVIEKEVLPMLKTIDAKVERVGKSVNMERGDAHGNS